MTRETRTLRGWLAALYVGVALMTVVGGITRLTGSGLSMVDWKPVTGVLPPLDHEAWVRAFDDYRASPQGRSVNAWMKLPDFERIFFWEYTHRLLGRVEFLVALLPWLYFKSTKRYAERARGLWLAPLLVAAQGALGWFMVVSGLSREPAVSHLRLAAHLGLAFFLAQWALWSFLSFNGEPTSLQRASGRYRTWSVVLLTLLCLQTAYGAFMGGKHAGHMYSTFPDMAGEYLPSSTFFSGNLANDLIHSPTAIHYLHRSIAWLVLAAGMGLSVSLLRRASYALRKRAALLSALLLVQVTLGALTVTWGVPMGLAISHQLAALLLLSAAVSVHHGLVRSGDWVDGPYAECACP